MPLMEKLGTEILAYYKNVTQPLQTLRTVLSSRLSALTEMFPICTVQHCG